MTINLIIKKILAFSFLLIIVFANANLTMAIGEDTLKNLNTSADKAFGTKVEGSSIGKPLPELVGKIIGTGLSFLGVIFMVLMIYGGFLWMTARGEGSQVTKAKDLIEAAIIGLVIVMSAYAITAWLGQKLATGN